MGTKSDIYDKIEGHTWKFIIAGIDILVCRDMIESRKEIDDYSFNEYNTIEYYNEDKEFVGEVDLKVICQFLEIPDLF